MAKQNLDIGKVDVANLLCVSFQSAPVVPALKIRKISLIVLKNNPAKSSAFINIYHWSFALIGAILFVYSLVFFRFEAVDLNFVVILILTLVLGSRVAMDFQAFKSNLSLADIFIYLTAMLYGIECATVIAATEAYITSIRFTKRIEFRAFNSGILAIAIFTSYQLSQLFFGPLPELAKKGFTAKLFGAMFLMIIAHYLINTFVVAGSNAFRSGRSILSTWTEYYVWMLIPFLASGSVAIIAGNIIQTSGFFAFFVILPFVGIIYFSYYTQQGKVQALIDQAEQNENHLLEMKQSEERFRSAFSNAPIGIGILSKEGRWLEVNDAFCKVFGFSEVEILEKKVHDLANPKDLVNILTNIALVIQGKSSLFQGELRFSNCRDEEIWSQTCISRLNDADDSKLIFQFQDITARHYAEEKLLYDARFDSLTNLANRVAFMEILAESFKRSMEDRSFRFSVLFVDLDRFKLVNDIFGHTVGDKLLKAVSDRITRCLPYSRDVDIRSLARFGSDEFLILLEDKPGNPPLNIIAEEIQRQVGLVFGIGGQQIRITASIGIVENDETHESEEDILCDADTALHIAKTQGRSRYVIFDEQMRERARNQMKLEKDLLQAVERRELFLVYQPIISLATKRIAGFEALVRWNHPTLGLVSPADFVPIAEESGAILSIGKFVLDEACRQHSLWKKRVANGQRLWMSINVSTKQLLQKKFLIDTLEVFEKYRIEPSEIKLEITESILLEYSDAMISVLRQFRAIGLNLSMDDFGTGYSSLSYLRKLPLSSLKIDRSFISQICDESESSEIVKSIILLSKTLKLEVVAEGIETAAQDEMLRQFGCDLGQGYYYSKPLYVEDVPDYFNETARAQFEAPAVPVLESGTKYSNN